MIVYGEKENFVTFRERYAILKRCGNFTQGERKINKNGRRK